MKCKGRKSTSFVHQDIIVDQT